MKKLNVGIDYGVVFMKKKYESFEDWKEYYERKDVQYKISFHTRYREVIFIKHLKDKKIVIRPIKIFKPHHFKYWYNRLGLDKLFFDMYISNASVKLPLLTSKLDEMKNYREYLDKHWEELLTGYDFFVDIDADEKDEQKAINWAKIIREDLLSDGYGKTTPVTIWTTGSGGVHVVLKGRFNPFFVKEKVMNICCKHSIPMSNPVKIVNEKKFIPVEGEWKPLEPGEKIPAPVKPYVDVSVYDIRRIRRVPYCLHSKTGKPMLPVF